MANDPINCTWRHAPTRMARRGLELSNNESTMSISLGKVLQASKYASCSVDSPSTRAQFWCWILTEGSRHYKTSTGPSGLVTGSI